MEDEDDAIRELVTSAFPETLITNYVVIAETYSGSGAHLLLSVSEDITPWLAEGMLNSAMDMLAAGIHESWADNDE
jgi:hypothetical protein